MNRKKNTPPANNISPEDSEQIFANTRTRLIINHDDAKETSAMVALLASNIDLRSLLKNDIARVDYFYERVVKKDTLPRSRHLSYQKKLNLLRAFI